MLYYYFTLTMLENTIQKLDFGLLTLKMLVFCPE